MRNTLAGLPRRSPPPELVSRLQVLASREALRRRRKMSFEAFFAHVLDESRLFFQNVLRPYAVPAAGGLASTVVLFALLSPALTIRRGELADVPIGLSTEVSVESSLSLGITGEYMDIVVEVWVDEQGKMTSYSIPRGQAWSKDLAIVRGLENTLLLTKFTPATLFGQKAAGRARVTIRRSHVDVIG